MIYTHCVQDDPSDPNRRKGLYKAKIIQKCANVMWFANRKDEGAMYPELFGPIFPRPAFAFILTVVGFLIAILFFHYSFFDLARLWYRRVDDRHQD
jgi:hypothetical protein